ncbi:hypothetical protein VKT23_016063 [Stygiomarasmius scandens]|uniref:Uncharacterized protein n=1 Tax=Marasmiellus scandens TaxID=2682957 RepID=A0ABR1IVY3_9AGAR
MPRTPTKARTTATARSTPYSSPTKNSSHPQSSYGYSSRSFPSTPTKSARKATSSSPIKRTAGSPRKSAAGGIYKFNFGMHRGKTIAEVPWDYIQWCIDEGVLESRFDLRIAVEEFQRQKRSTASSSRASQPIASSSRTSQSVPSTSTSASLLSIDQRYAKLKQTIPEWLYDECIAVLEDGQYDFLASPSQQRQRVLERLEILESMARSDFPKQYPPRAPVSYTLPDGSKSVKDLRRALGKCPKLLGSFREPTADEKKYLEHHYDGFSGESWYTLAEGYRAVIQRCLKDVEKEHGMAGRQIANWEVRDKYAVCVGGINYAGSGKNFSEHYNFVDQSAFWLRSD